LILFFSIWIIHQKKPALYMAIVLLSGFIVIDALPQIKRQNRKELIVYNLSEAPVINYIGNNHNLLYTSDTSRLKNLLRYPIKNHWLSRKSKAFQLQTLYPPESQQANKKISPVQFLFPGGLRLAYLQGEVSLSGLRPQEKLNLDYIILADNCQVKIKELCRVFRFKKIILAPTIGYYQRQWWISEMERLHIPYHSIPEQGAFQVEWG
ncbi:MAG TPA: hypothetical protein VJ876_05005, partial [Bacteroidales bacterium]|nr:hypothetical protein [Bacteroidales bacterium]